MASVRPVYGLPSNPRDTARARRYASASDQAEVPSVTRGLRQQREATQLPTQAKSMDILPDTRPLRRPSLQGSPVVLGQTSQGPAQNSFRETSLTRPSAFAYVSSSSSSSAKSQDSISIPAKSTLRKKQPTRPGQAGHARVDSEKTGSSSSTSHSIGSGDPLEPVLGPQIDRVTTQSPAEIQVAQTIELPRSQAHTITIYPELDRYRNLPMRTDGFRDNGSFEVPFRLATHDLPPPTPAFSGTSSQLSAGSPSTRFSESPGPGAYSRDTTPTSISSQSPGLLASMRFAPHQKSRQLSPAFSRPPVTRRRAGSISNEADVVSVDPHGLAAVRESLTSSSSNSTVRDGEKRDTEVAAKKKKRLSPLPPSPPPRKSSQKFREENGALGSPPRQARGAVRLSPTQASPSKSTIGRSAIPPRRPSRDDTPDLQTQLLGPPPVVLSNLTILPVTGERPGSAGRHGTTTGLPRRTTPSPSLKADRASPLPVGREPTPNPRSISSPVKSPEKMSKSPNTSTFTRFPFFGKRSKTTPDLSQSDDKPARRGPVAGTGHEGYGRIGSIRRRSGSLLVGREKPGPGVSQGGLSGNQSVDTFLQDRMNPVVISGGEIVHKRNLSSDLSQTESSQSFAMSRPSMDSRGDSDFSTTSSVGKDPKKKSSLPRSARVAARNRRPSDSSDSEAGAMRSTLAYRRSVQRLRSSPEEAPLRLPKPINTSRGASPSINSKDTSVRTDDSFAEAEAARGRKAATTTPPPRKLTKRAKSPRKWNPFSRSQSRPRKNPEPEPVSATVNVVQQPQIPFYAMMDGSEQEDMEPQNIEDVLRDAHVFEPSPNIPTPPPHNPRDRLPSEPLRSPTKQLPTAEVVPTLPPSPQHPRQLRRVDRVINPVQAEAGRTPSRPSRLPQVGRIPKVVNTRVEPTSPRSFSRPFNRLSFQRAAPDDTLDDEFVAKGPSPPKPSTPDLVHETSTAGSGESGGSHNRDTPPDLTQTAREFLAMSPNKKYQGHTSSSSSGSNNYAFAYGLSIVPDPNGPLVEDEIWDEYNDLIGDVPPSATSSKGTPFHLEAYDRTLSKPISKPTQALESPTLAQPRSRSILAIAEEECVTESESSSFSGDMTERIKKAFAQKPETIKSGPSSPAAKPKASPKLPRTPKLSVAPSIKSPAMPERGLSNASNLSRKSDSGSSCKSSEDESPLAQVNLRVGSMTVSKWLSFGHVLFSPAREELIPDQGSLKRHSILVIDGLGNDDWSFYAAETYPAATFFNMSPRAPLPASRQTASNYPLSPPNHHQIQYVSHMEKFPFSLESFTSVVYRFPAAAPESYYRNIVSEARRVLKPGGYIELSILDVDLNNMGNRGRREIRRLKERIHEVTPDTSLGSSSDLVVRLLGQNGFSDIKTCHVGVPVASVVAKPLNADNKASAKELKRSKEQRSLADMMNDKSDSADENITKMVAKVGRWWYTRCYETAAGSSSSSRSIWANRALLAECEELRTSLKLMVCYARVPERSRVASI